MKVQTNWSTFARSAGGSRLISAGVMDMTRARRAYEGQNASKCIVHLSLFRTDAPSAQVGHLPRFLEPQLGADHIQVLLAWA
jgi:hypothetical protein